MEIFDDKNDSIDIIKNQLLLICATKGCTFLMFNFLMVMYYVIINGFFPYGRFYLHPYCVFYYLLACAVFFTPKHICRLCAKYTGCMVSAALVCAFVMRHMSDHYLITNDIVVDYAMPFVIIAVILTLCFWIFRRPIIGYLLMTFAFIIIIFTVEYFSLNFIGSREILLLPDYLFFSFLEFVLQGILISVGYLIDILYRGEDKLI